MELTEKQKEDIGKGIYRIVEGVGAPGLIIKTQLNPEKHIETKKN